MTNKEKTHYENGAYKSLLLTHHFCAAYLKALLIHKPYTHLYTHTYIYIYIYIYELQIDILGKLYVIRNTYIKK